MVDRPVKFNGGPLNGVAAPSQFGASPATFANILFRNYQTKPPPPGVGWWMVHCELVEDAAEPDGVRGVSHYYRIDPQLSADGGLVAEYGGTEHPTDHTHDNHGG
jgi:hypothetical protein